MLKAWKKVFVFTLAVGVCLSLGATLYFSSFLSWLQTPVLLEQADRELNLENGQSLYRLAFELHEKKIIAHPRAWVRYAQYKNLTAIKAGEYLLPEESSPLVILELLNKGEVQRYQLTFAEGLAFRDWLKLLHTQDKLQKKLEGIALQEIPRELGLDITHPEGWFFPETYTWTAADSDKSLLLQAHRAMKKILEEEWQGRAENLPYESAYEALIMASIIEKETGAAHERGEIAGVFVRRLKKNMRLQTDPTVIYGMGENYKGNITRKDLRTETAYNTYVIKGLPPTPIAMPGREAIHAALHPEEGDSLYFVAKGDGTHVFSRTVEEHNRAVRQYQLRRRADYRSSPIEVKKSSGATNDLVEKETQKERNGVNDTLEEKVKRQGD